MRTVHSGLDVLAIALPLALGVVACGIPGAIANGQSPTAGFARADTAALSRTLREIAAAHHGVLGYTVHNLDTGESFSLRGDETFPTASLIKVSILVTLYDLVEKNAISLDDPLTVLKIDQVPGSGVLTALHPGNTITVRDAAVLMITLSDNTATNLLLDKIAIKRVWEKMEALGLPHTKPFAKVFLRISSLAPDSSVKYGLGVTTPNEMASLFAMLANGKAVSPAADSAMLDILEQNEDGDKLERGVAGLTVARKTGMTDSVKTECALYQLQSRVVVCGLTKENLDTRWMADNEAQVTLGKLGAAVAGAWPRKAKTARLP